MTDPDRRLTEDPDTTDERSDIEQAVAARSDALERGEGGKPFDGVGGEGGADGVVRNQGDDGQ